MSSKSRAIVDKARSQIGKKDNDKGCPKEGCYSGNGGRWCSEFVSWVYKEAGYPLTGGKNSKKKWLLTNTKQIRDWFKNKKDYLDRDDADWNRLAPSPGDYVFIRRFSKSTRKHSGLVERVSGNDLHTIEGNNAGRKVARYVYPEFRTNMTDGPSNTNGYVRGIGLMSAKRLCVPNGAHTARAYFDVAIRNAFARRFNPDLGLAVMVLQQMAAGLREMARTPIAITNFNVAIHNAFARRFNPDLGLTVMVLQQMAAGLKEIARTPTAITNFDVAIHNAFTRRFSPDLSLVVMVLQQMAAGLKADVD